MIDVRQPILLCYILCKSTMNFSCGSRVWLKTRRESGAMSLISCA